MVVVVVMYWQGSCCCNERTDRRWELISVGDGGITIKYLHSKYSQLTTEINNFPQIGDVESTLRAVTYRKTVGLIFKEKKWEYERLYSSLLSTYISDQTPAATAICVHRNYIQIQLYLGFIWSSEMFSKGPGWTPKCHLIYTWKPWWSLYIPCPCFYQSWYLFWPEILINWKVWNIVCADWPACPVRAGWASSCRPGERGGPRRCPDITLSYTATLFIVFLDTN